jgi:hypothetical protein
LDYRRHGIGRCAAGALITPGVVPGDRPDRGYARSMSVFSRRHRHAIADGKLDVQLDARLRGRIWRLMGNYNESFSHIPDPGSNWSEETDSFEQVHDALLDISGESALNIDGTTMSLEAWIADGPAIGMLDAVELFCLQLGDDRRPPFTTDLNRLLGEEDASWRLLDGQFVLLDAVFVHEQVVASTQQTLHSVRFEGAAQEMLAGQHDLADRDARGAVHNAGKSFESAMKAALGREDHLAAKRLIDALLGEGFFDGLPEDLRSGFANQVMLALPWMRNHLGGHGQGREEQALPEPYARLALGLAAVVNEFIVGLAIERDASLVKVTDQRQSRVVSVSLDESDFMPSPMARDDDIPF